MWNEGAWSDGTAYVTQCPISKGKNFTYVFQVSLEQVWGRCGVGVEWVWNRHGEDAETCGDVGWRKKCHGRLIRGR